jgi:glycosyltransferase involved in cell wall biosynthesis
MIEHPLVSRVVTRLNIGGPARHVLLLSQRLLGKGFRTALISGSEGPQEGRIDPVGIENYSHLPELKQPIAPASDLKAFRGLYGMFKKQQPTIVHTHTAKAGALGRFAARRAGVPIVVHTFHGHVLEAYFSPLKENAFLRTERWLAKRTDALIAVSPQIRDELLDLGIGRPDQWEVVPLGLDLDDLLTGVAPRDEALRSFELGSEGPVVGIVGRLVPIKDHALFFDVAQRVLEDHPATRFVVAGDGELRASLEGQARERFGDRMKFLGWVRDLRGLYGALDVVVLTSKNEGTPVALIEAAASGRPAVATAVGGVDGVVLDGRTGYLAPAGDAAAIAAKVSALLSDPGLRSRFGAAARDHCAERFGAARLVEDVDRLYRNLMRARA